MRILNAVAPILLLATAAGADAVVVKTDRGAKKVLGLHRQAKDGTPITPQNFRAYLDESKLEIVTNRYDGLDVKERGRTRLIPRARILDFDFTERPEDLDEGYQQKEVQGWTQALRAFGKVKDDAEVRPVFREAAAYEYGRCLVARGEVRAAQAYFRKWTATRSWYTPE
ncbi:MAG: hypothetical protein ACE5JG_08290, partial [Planctomycetota bacterium]